MSLTEDLTALDPRDRVLEYCDAFPDGELDGGLWEVRVGGEVVTLPGCLLRGEAQI